MERGFETDLFVFLADADAEKVMSALLQRPESLGIHRIGFEIKRYAGRDAGCYSDAVEFTRTWQRRSRHLLVLFDHHGSGQDRRSREAIETELEKELDASGWGDRASVIVLEPELESWVWSESPHVSATLGWPSDDDMRAFLVRRGYLERIDQAKPDDPKNAVRAVLREKRKPLSSSLFNDMASHVGGLDRCEDAGFRKLLTTLRTWFPSSSFPS